MTKDDRFELRIPAAMRERMDEASKLKGVSVSELARRALQRELRKLLRGPRTA